MKKNLIIVNNEKCTKNKDYFFCENIEISSITQLLGNKFNIKLILREAAVKPVYKINNQDVLTATNIFFFIKNIIKSSFKDKGIYLIISVTPYTFISFLFLFLLRKKIFLYLRSDGKKEISVIFGKKISLIYKMAENLMAKFSTLIVVNEKISQKKKLHLVNPSQIDEEWYKNTVRTTRSEIKLLYVGRVKVEKGIFSLINLFNGINNNKKIQLTVIGQGNSPENLNEKIKFLGPISNKKDLIKQYDQHDIFILPSYTEGHPQVLIESLAREKPVIIFREIEHVASGYEGVFVIDRNEKDLSNIIKFIDENYNKILEKIKKNVYPTKESFLKQLSKILD